MAQFSLLNAIEILQPFDLRTFAEEFGFERTTLIRNLDRLRRKGLVDAENIRSGLSLTAEGRDLLLAAFPDWEGAQVEVKKRLGNETWQTTFEVVDRAAKEL